MENTSNVSFVQACVVGVVAALVVGIFTVTFNKHTTVINQAAAVGSPTGTTFNTAKFAGINFSLATATSTSIVNGDASDRYIMSLELACSGVGTSQTAYTGAGLASLTFKGATTTGVANGTAVNVTVTTSLAFSTTIATSSGGGIATQASSTPSLGAIPAFQVWAAGSSLVLFTNATNTAACTGGVRYLAS